MSEMSVIISSELEAWIKARLAEGRHADASDYIRDLIQRDQEQALDHDEDTARLRAQIQEGLASGIADADAFAIMDGLIAKNRAANG